MRYSTKRNLLNRSSMQTQLWLTTLAMFSLLWWQLVSAVELDVPYVETPDDIATLMMDMAQITPQDYVIDLGTGDGRLVLAAVKRGASGLGVDLDPQRIEEANANASKAGVTDKVKFVIGDLFKTDISQATVLTLFLNSEVNMRLRPILFEQLKPGTRVVSHNFDMEDWQPDQQQELMVNDRNNFYIHDIFYWVIPAKVEGDWQWQIGKDQFQMSVNQQFQNIKAELRLNDQTLIVKNATVAGTELKITAVNADGSQEYILNGQVTNDNITGTISSGLAGSDKPADWQATRK